MKMECPITIPALPALAWRLRLRRIAGKPVVNVVVIELLRPQQAGVGLSLHQALVLGEMRPLDGRIELVGFGKSTRHYQIEMSERPCLCLRREPNLYGE